QGFVVAALHLPAVDRFLANTLAADRQARHVVRCIDRKEQYKSQKVYTKQNQCAIHQAPYDVSNHEIGFSVLAGPRWAGATLATTAVSRLRICRHATATPTSSVASTSNNGHQMGWFHARTPAARSCGSRR